MSVYSTKDDYYIQPGAINITLNALGDYDKIAVSLAAGTVILAYHEGIIDYNAALAYRRWALMGTNTRFNRSAKVYVYVRLSKIGDTADLIYPYEKIPLDPAIEDESDESDVTPYDTNYYYIMLGSLTASEIDGTRRARIWDDEIEWGERGTDKKRDESDDELQKMFKLVGGVIYAQRDLSFIAGMRMQLFRMYALAAGGAEPRTVQITSIADEDSITDADFEGTDTSIVTSAAMVQYQMLREDVLNNRYLRKDQDDSTPYKLSMGEAEVQGVARVKDVTIIGKQTEDADEQVRLRTQEWRDSISDGQGAGITNKGRGQFQNVEVRGAFTAMELIINQLHTMAGDFYFTESGIIESVEALPGTNRYRLYMRYEHETDVIDIWEEDIILSIANNLRTHKKTDPNYYVHPSWMRTIAVVQRTDESDESEGEEQVSGGYIDVELYDGEYGLYVGSTNFVPEAGFVLVRRGNYGAASAAEGSPKHERARTWHISNTDGMLSFLDYMYTPVVGDENYQTTVGKLPQVQVLIDWFRDAMNSQPQKHVGVYSQFMFAENFVQLNWMGRVMTTHNDRGDWSLQTAQGAEPYKVEKITQNIGGEAYVTTWRTDTVQHLGCVWACNRNGTTAEPYWGTTDWVFVSGSRDWDMEISNVILSSLRSSQMLQIKLRIAITFNGFDVTNLIKAQGAQHIAWTRITDNPAADITFNNNVISQRAQDAFWQEMIFYHNTTTKDLGDNFLNTKMCSFNAVCEVPYGGGEDVTIQKTIPIV